MPKDRDFKAFESTRKTQLVRVGQIVHWKGQTHYQPDGKIDVDRTFIRETKLADVYVKLPPISAEELLLCQSLVLITQFVTVPLDKPKVLIDVKPKEDKDVRPAAKTGGKKPRG